MRVIKTQFYLSQILKEGEGMPEIVWNCGECGADFATERQLKAHVRNKHSEYLQKSNRNNNNKHYCGECGAVFATEGKRREHIRKKHPQYLPEEAIAKIPVKKRRIQGRRRN